KKTLQKPLPNTPKKHKKSPKYPLFFVTRCARTTYNTKIFFKNHTKKPTVGFSLFPAFVIIPAMSTKLGQTSSPRPPCVRGNPPHPGSGGCLQKPWPLLRPRPIRPTC